MSDQLENGVLFVCIQFQP